MPRTTVTKDGIVYRTKHIRSWSRVQSFARCLAAHAAFRCVNVVQVNTGGHVTYQPVSQDKQEELIQEEWSKRVIKGYTEGMDYVFMLDDTGAFWWCLSTSGGTYEVTSHSCDCWDKRSRCRRLGGIPCKHIQALDAQRSTGVLGKNRQKAA